MEPLIAQLNKVFDIIFPGSRHPLGPVIPDATTISGFIIWNGFEEKSQRERQAAVWNALRDNLKPDELRRVTAILTVTPLEEQAILENE